MLLKLNNLGICALVLFPMAAIAQTPVPSMPQAQTVDQHHAEEAAVEHVMTQFHEAATRLQFAFGGDEGWPSAVPEPMLNPSRSLKTYDIFMR